MMLDAVYVDMQSGTIEGVKPKPEFLPLFNLAQPVRAGETVLVTALLDSTPSPNTHILLPSGITVIGVEDWVTKLADVA